MADLVLHDVYDMVVAPLQELKTLGRKWSGDGSCSIIRLLRSLLRFLVRSNKVPELQILAVVLYLPNTRSMCLSAVQCCPVLRGSLCNLLDV